MLTSGHIRAARAMLKLTQPELAKISEVSVASIKKYEIYDEAIAGASQKTITKIKIALESKGIRFLNPKEDGSIDGIGVRYFPSENKASKKE